MDQLILIVESVRNFDDPLRTIAVVDFEDVIMFGGRYFPNKICWSTTGGYWGVEWVSKMKVLKRVE